MTDTPLRKFVKPAHKGARIPDPAHRGIDLPQDGASVVWDHYWIARERRGEIIVDAAKSAPAAATTSASPAATV